MIKNTHERYGWLAKWLHWLTGLGVIALICIGFYMTTFMDHNNTMRSGFYAFHKSLALTILVLLVLRLIWRFSNPKPDLKLKRAHQIISRIVQDLLYLSSFVMILAGWAMSSFSGHPVAVWGEINATWPVGKDRAVSQIFSSIHTATAWVLIVLIVLHAAAAIYHRLILKDNILAAMLH